MTAPPRPPIGPVPAAAIPAPPPTPEFCSSRRRFLVAAVMLGWAPPERLTERVLGEITEGPSE
jgi:hypothetical protein